MVLQKRFDKIPKFEVKKKEENLKNSPRIEREVVIQERSESPPISSTLENSCKGLDIFCNSFLCKSYSNH